MASIDQDIPDTSLKVEFVKTDSLILPFTKPAEVPFIQNPVAYVVEDLERDSTVLKLELGSGIEVLEDTMTMTLEGASFDCYLGQKLYIVMSIINEGRRDAIIEMTVKHAPE